MLAVEAGLGDPEGEGPLVRLVPALDGLVPPPLLPQPVLLPPVLELPGVPEVLAAVQDLEVDHGRVGSDALGLPAVVAGILLEQSYELWL